MSKSATANFECSSDSWVHGKRLLPTWIDDVGRKTPEKPWALMPRSSDLKDGFREYHYRHLVAAIDTLAWWIESIIGRSTTFETVAYMGLSDMRYNIIPMALMKTGHKTLFMSHRHSGAWHKELMEKTSCKTLIFSAGIDSEDITANSPVKTFQVAELDHLLSTTGVKPYLYDKTFEEAKHDPIVIVHTSGTTGMPKPIVWTHAIYATIDAHMIPSDLAGRKNVYATMKTCKRQYSSMPVAHSPGLVRFLRAIFMDVTLVIGPTKPLIGPDPASLECVEEILRQTSADAAYFLPSTLEALCKSPRHLEGLSKLRLVGFGGGPLSKEAGDAITEHCPQTIIHNSLGSSDGGAFVTYEPDREDWQYICYCPDYNGIDWRPTAEGLYEMVIVRDPNLEMYQGAFKINPDLHERSTRDLYSKHPTKPHHWRHEARVDDLIVCANGAKFNPQRMQMEVQQHPDVRFALMTGSHRHRPALIVQLQDPAVDDREQRRRIQEEVWAIVSKMNAEFPIQGKVMESLIMYTMPGKDFPLAGKATLQRVAAIEMYQSELDDLYTSAGPELVKAF